MRGGAHRDRGVAPLGHPAAWSGRTLDGMAMRDKPTAGEDVRTMGPILVVLGLAFLAYACGLAAVVGCLLLVNWL
jgi:hypothetical protein